MELLPLGPVVMMDTPGIDDEGDLGNLRVKKSYQVLNKADVAVLVIDGTAGASEEDRALLIRIREKKIPYVVVLNKKELAPPEAERDTARFLELAEDHMIFVSAADGSGIHELKEMIGRIAETEEPEKYLVRDLLAPSDVAVLVVPIDSAAPKGRLILPQQQTIRDILGSGCHFGCGKGDGTERRAGQTRYKTEDGDHRQPGICPGCKRHAG